MATTVDLKRRARTAMLATLKAPDAVIERHLVRKHGKKPSWLQENREYLRIAHQLEHGLGRATDHAVGDDLLS